MSEFNSAIDFVGAQAGYVATSHVAREEEERIAHPKLHSTDLLWLHLFIRRNAAAAIDRASGVGAAGRAGGRALPVRVAQRSAAIDVAVPTAVRIIALN